MADPLDPLWESLRAPGSPSSSAILERARATAREELALGRPVIRWRTEALRTVGLSWGVGVALALLGLAANVTSPALLGSRGFLLAVLGVAGATCIHAALSPRSATAHRAAALAVAAGAGAWMLLSRSGPVAPAGFPDWVCSASHLAAGLPPLWAGWLALRKSAPRPLRTLLVGLGAGTTGALVGEIACKQGVAHVAAYHLGAWLLVVGLGWALGRWGGRTAYAP